MHIIEKIIGTSRINRKQINEYYNCNDEVQTSPIFLQILIPINFV